MPWQGSQRLFVGQTNEQNANPIDCLPLPANRGELTAESWTLIAESWTLIAYGFSRAAFNLWYNTA